MSIWGESKDPSREVLMVSGVFGNESDVRTALKPSKIAPIVNCRNLVALLHILKGLRNLLSRAENALPNSPDSENRNNRKSTEKNLRDIEKLFNIERDADDSEEENGKLKKDMDFAISDKSRI